jgi:hypothetical protein
MGAQMLKTRITLLLLLALILFVFGCAPVITTKGVAFPKMYQQKPLTVLALPPVNTTSSPVAKEYMICTVAQPVANNGFYVLSTELSNEILKNEGLYDTETINPSLYPKFKEMFNVDALLFSTIFKWDTSYYVVGGNVTVGLKYSLISTTTGDTLWSYYGIKKVDTTQQNQGGGLAGLAIALIATAATTAATDYLPIARDVNNFVFSTIPVGRYSTRHNLDQNDQLRK